MVSLILKGGYLGIYFWNVDKKADELFFVSKYYDNNNNLFIISMHT